MPSRDLQRDGMLSCRLLQWRTGEPLEGTGGGPAVGVTSDRPGRGRKARRGCRGRSSWPGMPSCVPPRAELLRIAEYECAWRGLPSGATHPSLLCARLYGEQLGNWQTTLEVEKETGRGELSQLVELIGANWTNRARPATITRQQAGWR